MISSMTPSDVLDSRLERPPRRLQVTRSQLLAALTDARTADDLELADAIEAALGTTVTSESLTNEAVIQYFNRHCRCASPDIERREHSDIDCDLDACECAHVALGGQPYGTLHPRSTQTALLQRLTAREHICDVINFRATSTSPEWLRAERMLAERGRAWRTASYSR